MKVARWAGAGVILVTAALGGCAVKPVPISQASNPLSSPAPVTSPSMPGAVPWVDRPGSGSLGSPLPASPLPTAGPPCAASSVRAVYDGAEGAAGSFVLRFTFTNASTETCALRGTPRIVATEPGKRPVTATPANLFPVVPVAMSPGDQTHLDMQAMRDCAANNAGAGPVSTYHALAISMPGGGSVTVRGNFDVECGLYVGEFGVQPPDPTYPTPPLAGAISTLELPASVTAGEQMRYVVDIANPTAADMVLSPCPSYVQSLGLLGKELLQLNCDVIHDIAAGQTVRFAMELGVPARTPTGPARACWSLAGPVGVTVGACGSVEVVGREP